MMFLFDGKTLLGVDIGSYSLKIVKLSGGKGAFSLEAGVSIKYPKTVFAGGIGTGAGGGGAPEPLALSGFISEVMRSERIKGKTASTALTGAPLIFRHLHLPYMPEKDLLEAVRWEIRKEIAIPPGDIVVDYVYSSPGAGGGGAGGGGGAQPEKGAMLSIFAFATKRQDAERLIGMFKDAGLELKTIDVVPTALMNSFDVNNDWEDGVNYAFADIGEKSTTLAIFRNRRLSFTREISFGGGDITAGIANESGLDADEADDFKVTHGLTGAEEEDPGKALIISTSLERLCADMQRSFDYYQAQFREGPPLKIFLSGGTARLKGIEEFITRTVGIGAFAHDPLKKVKVPRRLDTEALRAVSPALNVAVGLSARKTA